MGRLGLLLFTGLLASACSGQPDPVHTPEGDPSGTGGDSPGGPSGPGSSGGNGGGVTPPPPSIADIRGDTNRDGVVRFDASDAEKSVWDARNGAVFLANAFRGEFGQGRDVDDVRHRDVGAAGDRELDLEGRRQGGEGDEEDERRDRREHRALDERREDHDAECDDREDVPAGTRRELPKQVRRQYTVACAANLLTMRRSSGTVLFPPLIAERRFFFDGIAIPRVTR